MKILDEAYKWMRDNGGNYAMRSCWKCNSALEHLKKAEYVIMCFGCGHWFYKGKDLTKIELKGDKEDE